MRKYRFFGVMVLTAMVMTASAELYLDSHELPLVAGSWGRFRQNTSLFMWTPFDSIRTHWDLTNYPGGYWTRSGLRDYLQGRAPAPDSMENDPPDPEIVTFDTLGTGEVQWSYLHKDTFGLYLDGIDFDLIWRFIGNYRPDQIIYTTPMYRGAGWMTAIIWSWLIEGSIPYSATEQHTKRIVAKGKVKIPMSGDYYWPCLVIRDHYQFSDNIGSIQDRWIYEWVVPGHFVGGNGVAAALSQNGASQNFFNVEQFFQLDALVVPGWDLVPPTFANTTVWPDTSFLGPFLVGSDITDNSAVGAESLYYRVNGGDWIGLGPDSALDARYWFVIPELTASATIDYFVWAKDSFCVNRNIDCWTTWPVCSPESTMISFRVTTVGVEQEPPTRYQDPCLAVGPNPARGPVRFSLSGIPTGRARVRVFSVTGATAADLALRPTSRGLLEADWHGQGLPAGTYLYRVEASGFLGTGKLQLSP